MEVFRKKLKQRSLLLALFLLFAVGLIIYDVFFADAILRYSSTFSFQCGLALGFAFLAIIKIIQYQKALKDEKVLQATYNKENDERAKYIRSKAGMPTLMITSCLMLAAGVIAGYFNQTVFVTLIVASMVQLSFSAAIKTYYLKAL